MVRQHKVSEATLDLLNELGVIIYRKIDENLHGVRVPVFAEGYLANYNDRTIFEGTEEALGNFVKKLDDIRQSGGKSGVASTLEKLKRLKIDIQGYIKIRKELKQIKDSKILLNLFEESVTVKHLDAVVYYEEMLKKFPKLRGELDFSGEFRQVNFAEFSIKKGNKGVYDKEIKELYHSGEEHFYDEFTNPFDNELAKKQFQKGIVDIKGGSRKNDSEAKFIFNFLKEHLHTADEFIIETKNIYFTCTSCQREIVMLKKYVEKLGKKIEIIVHGDIEITGADKLYEKMIKK